MTILRKNEFKFEVVKEFLCQGRVMKIGEILTLSGDEATDLFLREMIEPTDLPQRGIYITLTNLEMPGKTNKFSAPCRAKVILLRKDALSFLRSGMIVPVDNSLFRPNGKTLCREEQIVNVGPVKPKRPSWVYGWQTDREGV